MPNRRRTWASVSLLLVLTEAVYFRPSVFWRGNALFGADYLQLHVWRIAFALVDGITTSRTISASTAWA